MSSYVFLFLVPFFLLWGVANDLFFDGGEAMTIVYTICLMFTILLFICSVLFIAMGGNIGRYIKIRNTSGHLLSNMILIPFGIIKDLGQVAMDWVKGHTMSAIVLAFTTCIMVGLGVLYDDKSTKKQFHVTGSFEHYKWIKVPPSNKTGVSRGGVIHPGNQDNWSRVFKIDGDLTIEEETVVDILIVGGGGAGGVGLGGWSGGGGSGEVKILTNQKLSPGIYSIVVGNGGVVNGIGGTDSSIIYDSFSETAKGGSNGVGENGGESGNSSNGGGIGTEKMGSGGGGGSSTAGDPGGKQTGDVWRGGDGGLGNSNDFETGIPKQYGGGGGGGNNGSFISGVGSYGGGSGSRSNEGAGNPPTNSVAGKVNTGGGGGGGTWRGGGAVGGSGIVVIRFSGNISQVNDDGGGQTYYEIESAFDNTYDVVDSSEVSTVQDFLTFNNMPVDENNPSPEICGDDTLVPNGAGGIDNIQDASLSLKNQNQETLNSGFLGVYVDGKDEIEAIGEAQKIEASGLWSLRRVGTTLQIRKDEPDSDWNTNLYVKVKTFEPYSVGDDKPLQVMNIIGNSIKQKEVTLSGYGKKATVTPYKNGTRLYEVKIACEHVYKKWLAEANKSKAGKISLAVNENPKRECARAAARDKLQRWGIVFLVYAVFMMSTSG